MIMTTKMVARSYNQEWGKKRQRSTWGLQLGGSQVIARDAKLKPSRLRSQRPRWLLVVAIKEEKEDNDQYENRDQEGCEQLEAQEMQDLDHQDQNHNNQEGC